MGKNIFFAYPERNQGSQENADSRTEQTSASKPPRKGTAGKKVNATNKDTKRTTLDLPKNLHKVIKRVIAEEETTIISYVINLIEVDLKGRGINY